MKLKLLFIAIGLFVGFVSYGQIISQYVETNTGTTPKGIEIWNNTSGVLNFATNNLVIQQGTNGAALANVLTINSGTLAAGAVMVIGTSDIQTYLTGQSISVTFVTFAFSFNGNDSLSVRYGGTTTDIFGNPVSDPGTEWVGSGVSTANQNIAIISGITTGSSGFTNPSTRFTTTSTNPSTLPAGLTGFGIAPVSISTPTVTTTTVSATAQFSATSGGSISSQGGSAVTARGIIWGTTAGLAIAQAPARTSSSGTGTGIFTSYLAALKPNTTYFYRAYATNSSGTAYGNELSFTTPAQIGTQMAFWNFGPNASGYTTAVTSETVVGTPTLSLTDGTIDANGKDGVAYTDILNTSHIRGQSAGWDDIASGGNQADIIVGLNTTGYRDIYLKFDYKSESADQYDVDYRLNGGSWISVSTNTTLAPALFIDNDYNWNTLRIDLSGTTAINNYAGPGIVEFRINGFADGTGNDKFVFDNLEIIGTVCDPIITSPTAVSITTVTATLGGNITAIGCSAITIRGIEWSTSSGFANGTGTRVSTSGSFGTGVFTQPVTGLPASTTIYYKAFATNGTATVYTAEANFVTQGPEINVRGVINTNPSIPDGDTTPQGTDNTLFTATDIGSSQQKVFRIENLGTGTNSLTINSISMIGGNTTDFVVSGITFPTSISGGNFVDFTITFSPSSSGTRNTTLTIINNDSNESTYDFVIQGTGNCLTSTNNITPTSGPAGTEVTINATANNLTGATVSFNGTPATSIIYVSTTQIKVLVPSSAISGNLVTTNAQGCQASNTFTVIDNVASGCQGSNVANDLFISEVTDATTGGLSYVEIYNGTSSPINMNGYSLRTSFNGGASPTTLPLNNFTLNPGAIYVVAIGIASSPDASNTCSITGGNGSLANQTSTNSGINFDTGGNDYIGLFKNSTSSIIDSFGVSTSATWADVLGLGDRGATFRRKNTASLVQPIIYSNSDWNITDWVGTAQASCSTNDYSDIGTYNFISGTPPMVATPTYTANCKTATITVVGTEGYDGPTPADTKDLAYRWFFNVPNTADWTEITADGGVYTTSATATLSISNISSVLNYQYYCQVRENTNTCYTASNAVKIIDASVTWNGTNWRDVNNVITTPTISKTAIISSNYSTASGSFEACTVVVNTNRTLTITANNYVKIQNELINNGTVTINHNGSLVQVSDAAINTGNITYERNYEGIGLYDYTYWSSPVAGQNLLALSPTTKLDKFYYFNASINDWQPVNPATTPMDIGKGYIIRAAPWTGPPPGFLKNSFVGIPNNGVKNVSIFWNGATDGTSNLIGNPYPSAIDAVKFLTTNAGVIESTIYFWTHATSIQNRNLITGTNPDGTPKAGTGELAYTTDDYASFNLTGGVATGNIIPGTPPAEEVSNRPNGKIAAGQAFFATSLLANGTATFNNSMRLDNTNAILDNSQFFKTKKPQTKTATIEKHRIWLNLRNTQGVFKQTLIGYLTEATNQYDSRFDGISFDANEFADFYSVNQDKNLVIQGRALPFDENDEVPLGFRTTIDGAFTINIDQADGVLTNQAVFIEDKLANTIFDLRNGPFTFTTKSGTFNDRFVLRYTNKTLGTIVLETGENQVLVSNKNKQIKINSAVEIIDKVTVYDLLGRQLFKKDKVNNTELSILNLISNAQTLLVKVTLQNGETVTRKILY